MDPVLPHLKLDLEPVDALQGQLLLTLPVEKKDIPQKSSTVLASAAYMPPEAAAPTSTANGVGFSIASMFSGVANWLKRAGIVSSTTVQPAPIEAPIETPDAIHLRWNEKTGLLSVTLLSTGKTVMYPGKANSVKIFELIGSALPNLTNLPESIRGKVTLFQEKWRDNLLTEVTGNGSQTFSFENMYREMNFDCKLLFYGIAVALLNTATRQKQELKYTDRDLDATLRKCDDDTAAIFQANQPMEICCKVEKWMEIVTQLQKTIGKIRAAVVQQTISATESDVELLIEE